MGDLREPDGGVAAGEDRPSESPSTFGSSNSSPSSIGAESWDRAEKAIQKIIFKVQPTAVSEERRKEVIDYVQRLMKTFIGCEVFPYGSVPLKTYLPDGDIDLTAFGGVSSEDVLAEDIVSVLEGEEQNKAADFLVKDVQLIRAEVKLVKCIVQNIVVDISFNQIGGLCTLCFLEQVDRLIGKEHLFKRSIILVKSWCYYESRILGAHHGLFSTYALETLVLYIFHLFHSSLNGPLAVLYTFLDYFSKFDWENYCVSLSGPIRLSSLPEFVVERPDNGGGNLLLTSDFLGYCVDMFSVPPRGVELNSRTFQPKYLNIVDPLKENNNLGRSVSKGNFYRIRSAFTYGARKLRQILLMEPEDDIDEGLRKFFSNMLDRHGSGQRPDGQGPRHVQSYNGSGPALVVSETESCPVERVIPEAESMSCAGTMEDCRSNPNGSFHNVVSDMKASGGGKKYRNSNEEQEGTVEILPSKMLAEADQNTMGKALDERIFGDARDLATSRFESLEISNDFPKYPDLIAQESAAPVVTPYFAPHLYFSNSMSSNGDNGCKNSHRIQIENRNKNRYSGAPHGSDGDNGFGLKKDTIAVEDDILVTAGLKDVHLAKNKVSHPENLHPSARTPESLNPMPDLSGDFDNHFSYLLHGRSFFQYAGMASLPMNAPPPSLFQVNNSWDGAQQSSQFKQNGFSHVSMNGVIPSPTFYTVNPLLIPGMAFGLEEMPKPRGTGTYLPNVNRPLQGYRPSSARGRNQASSRSPRNNNRTVLFMENNVPDHSIHEPSQSPVSADQSGPKPVPSDINPPFSPRGRVHPNASALVMQSHGGSEIGSAGHVAEAPLLERRKQRQQKSLTSSPQNSSPVSPSSGMQRLKPVLNRDYDRLSMKSSYHLKDDDDFPPLSL